MIKGKILFLCNHLAFFHSHRRNLFFSSKTMGLEPSLFVGQAGHSKMERVAAEKLRSLGVDFTVLPLKADKLSVKDFVSARKLSKFLKNQNINILHVISLRMFFILFLTSIFGIPTGTHAVVSISGLGSTFSNLEQKNTFQKLKFAILALIFKFIKMRCNVTYITQNDVDLNLIKGISKGTEVRLFPGSGVDIDDFCEHVPKKNLIIHPARVLYDKGCREFFEVASILKPKYPDWEFRLIGAANYANKSKVPGKILNQWLESGYVSWHDHKSDISTDFLESRITCLFSKREGFPKVLVEAGFAKSAVVSSNCVGSREVYEHGVEALYCDVGDTESMANTVETLITNSKLRHRLTENAYNKATENYTLEKITELHKAIYDEYC